MRRELAAVYDELRRLQTTGEESVFLSLENLSWLKEVARSQQQAESTAAGEDDEAPRAGNASPAKPKAVLQVPEVPPPPVVTLPEGSKEVRWDALRKQVLSDSWCRSQVKPGKQVVFGVGSLEARIFFCGEAPGAEEEVQGEPFVGPAGQLLTKIIKATGLSREEVYIGNIMNYRPPMPGPYGNRPPDPAEMAYCLPYLVAQLQVVRPQVIVALGKTAVDGLLGKDPKRRMTRIRGKWTTFESIPLIPTFHPSYLLRNQGMQTKRQVWEDMLAVMEHLKMPITDKQRGYFLEKSD